jgi:hypothetical protein
MPKRKVEDEHGSEPRGSGEYHIIQHVHNLHPTASGYDDKRPRSAPLRSRSTKSWYMCKPEDLPVPEEVNAGFEIYKRNRDSLAPAVKTEKMSQVFDDDEALNAHIALYHSAALDLEIYDRQVSELHCILGLVPDGASDDAVSNLADSEGKAELERIRREVSRRNITRSVQVAQRKLKDRYEMVPEPLPSVFAPGYPVTKQYLDWEYYHIILIAPPLLEWRKSLISKTRSRKSRENFSDEQQVFHERFKTLQALYASIGIPVPEDMPNATKKLHDLFTYGFKGDKEE